MPTPRIVVRAVHPEVVGGLLRYDNPPLKAGEALFAPMR